MVHKKSVYFAHPISLYHTLTERVIVEAMRRRGYDVVNPSDVTFQRHYKEYCMLHPAAHPMQYWLELAERSDACVFCPFPREQGAPEVPHSNKPRVSAGVVKEVGVFHVLKRHIEWVLPDSKMPEEVVFRTFNGWREFKKLSVSETLAILTAQGVSVDGT